jgi:hypothetical protein
MHFIIISVIVLISYTIVNGLIQFIKSLIQDPKPAIRNLVYTREKLAVFIGTVAGLIYYFLN